MRQLLLLILLTISHFSFSQKLGPGSNTQKSAKVVDTVKRTTSDTAKLVLKDSIVIANKDLSNSDLKIFIQQPANGTDYFKYIFPILTLVMGIGINKLLDYISERKRIKKVGERWVAEIRYLDKPIRNQIEALEMFLIEHKKEKFIVPQMNIYSGLDCEIFKSLDKSDLLKFLEKKKKKDYKEAVLSSNKIHGYISILTSHYDTMKAKFEEYLKGTSAHATSLTQNLQLLMRAFGTYGVLLEKELNGDPINDPRYRPILDLFNAEIMPHMENGDFEIFKLKSDFFNPLLAVLGLLRHDQRINELVDYSSNCLNFIKGIQMEKKYLTENFETIKTFYKDELAELENVVKEVE